MVIYMSLWVLLFLYPNIYDITLESIFIISVLHSGSCSFSMSNGSQIVLDEG
jgi:hypothetical protein